MAHIQLSVGQVNITDYLIVRIREVDTPAAVVDSLPFGPAPSSVINLSFNDVNPVTFYVDFYESSDGSTLDTLLALYTVDARTNQLLYERRFYVVGQTTGADAGQPDIVDSYLNGKTIAGFSQRGFGALIPTAEWSFSVDTITNLIGNLSDGDTYYVDITYTQAAEAVSNKSFFAGVVDITSNTTFDSSHYNKRLRLTNGYAHTLPDAGTVPDGTFFYFVTTTLSITQTQIISPNPIEFDGITRSKLAMGVGEFLWLEKVTISGIPRYEVVSSHNNLQLVGQRFSATATTHLNTLAEDNGLYTETQYPRLYFWLNYQADAGTVIIDDNLDDVGYTRPANKQGCFILSITKAKFRMPDTRNLSEKGLKDFATFGTDASRAYDYPGGYQADQVGQFTVTLHKGDGYSGSTPTTNRFAPGQAGNPQADDNIVVNNGNENRIKNFGVIYCRHV